MAIINNNVQNVKFLRNQDVNITRDDAIALLGVHKEEAADGTALLARYTVSGTVKTIVGFVYVTGSTHDITIFDTEGASGDVEALRQEINAKLGTTFISSGNTVESNLTALSGGTFVPGTSSSADTSVEGAKAYAYDLIGTLDGGVTAETGYYVKSVSEVDGKISGSTEALPTVSDTAAAKKFVTKVDQTNGEISVSRGEITSSGKTIVLTDNADGGVNFEVNIDNDTLEKDENGVISVTSSALVQYEGDDDTVQISAVSDGVRTVSSPLTIQKVTTGLSEEVKEEYRLVGASGNTIGAPVQIYKDSHIVSITYITDTGDTHYQNLEYKYIDASGNTQTTYVDMSELVIEAEFASGVTVTDGVAHGVVDPTSETFLTVGADGFKLAGVQDAIDAAVADLDATVNNNANSGHVGVEIVETDGKLVSVTVTEDNIASADDIEELSAKTVTEIASSNASISATSSATADGTVKYDIVTDADNIQMSGFSADATSALSGIAESDSIATAFEKTNAVITENERVTAEALTNLRTDLDTVSGNVDTISGDLETVKTNYVSGVSVNGHAVTVANHVAPISISAATSAVTATSTEAIVVDTDANGNITLGLGIIDCGTY